MYWDETLPGSSNMPPRRGPDTVIGRSPSLLTAAPCARSASASGFSGRLERRPAPVSSADPRAAETGSMNRSVDPDSRQSSTGACAASRENGSTSKPSDVRAILAPSASRHPIVASISSDDPGQTIRVEESARAAQMSARCASDLEGMARMVPVSCRGSRRASISMRPPGGSARRTRRSRRSAG